MNTELYWLSRGSGYKAEFRKHNPLTRYHFWQQERAIKNELSKLDYGTVLEIGCGFGRITKILLGNPKVKKVVAIDLSDAQIANVNIDDQRLELGVANVLDLDYCGEFDLVIASEVLMHIPPDRIDKALYNMRRAAKRHIIHIDWYAPGEPKEAGGWCWQHDYPGDVIRKLHRQAIFYEDITGR